jgi:uncharacterized protein YijF (DUF1287 family)
MSPHRSWLVLLLAVGACRSADGQPARAQPAAPSSTTDRDAAVAHETCLGVADRGIWADLDPSIQLTLPADLEPDRVTATVDAARQLLIVLVDGWPTKPYPLGGPASLTIGDQVLALRPGDRAELAPLLGPARLRAAPTTAGDRDRDGLPDPLDVLIGARKTVVNADAYTSGYLRIGFPGGDVPRTVGVCTDVVVRALRNAGLDLQVELQRDHRRAPRAYPMIRGGGDANIDHRRVKTLLPYFLRAFDRRSASLDDPGDPLRPGDLVLFDTFPSRSGPDHIGIVSDRRGDSGLPLVINNWTDGTVTAEMDLLGWVPVTHRFRLRPTRAEPR